MSIKRFFPDTRPTLDLNFAATKRLDPRITYTRDSTGTFVGADGLIQSAAVNQARFDHNPLTGESLGLLVEEARTNISIYSETPTDASWALSNCSVTANAFLAPNGTVTAGKVVENTATAEHSLVTPNASGSGAFTASVYLRAAERTEAQFLMSDFATGGVFIDINLSTGTSTTSVTGGWTSTSSSATAAGNGWYRVSVTGTRGGSGTIRAQILPKLSGSTTYTGNGTSGIFIWGAQLEAGSFPTSYIPTPATFTGRTSTATFYDSAGIVQTAASGVARSNAFFPDENRIFRPAGLLIEAAGTNLLNHSQTFATSGGTQNDWVDTNVSRDVTLRTSPDGTANALRITASAANATVISSSGIGTSAARSLSIFLRRVTGSGAVEYTLNNGSTYTPQAITSSWVRYAFPVTTADQQVGIRLVTSGNAIELWGAQLETGASATSYIPTTTTTVTRSADTSTSATVTRAADVASMTGTNFSSWYNQSAGTFYAIYGLQNQHTICGIYADDGTSSNLVNVVHNSNSVLIRTAGVDQYYRAVSTNLGKNKQILAFAASSANSVINGSLGTTFTTATLPTVNRIYFFSLGTVDRLTYYPVRLPDAQLQALTAT